MDKENVSTQNHIVVAPASQRLFFNRIPPFPSVKPGVLRFVPTPTTDSELSRLPTNSSPLAPLRAQANSILGPNAIVPSPVALTTNQSAQALSMVKTQKKQRKDGPTAGSEFENTTRDREDVQSPAYSDISDDSTPVAETEMSGKFAMIPDRLLHRLIRFRSAQ